MAHPDLTSPLLAPCQSSDSSHTILTIHEPNHNHKPHQNRVQNQHQTLNTAMESSSNPFGFMGLSPISVPPQSTIDPFKNGTEKVAGIYELIKIVICLPIALIRLVVFGLCLGVGYLATRIALEGWKDKHNPMPRWRSRLMWITRICARFILFSFGYQWIRRKGKPAPREIAPIVVSNHVSYIEPIFYFYELFPTMVASESHDAMPFVGTIIRAMQVIYVNRFSPSSRKHAVNEIKEDHGFEQRKASCDSFPRVLLFPEGTTTNGRVLITFQLGAFIPAYPIQPVIVRYPHVHFDQSWGLISLGKLMFRMFTQFHNFMEVEYLPVVFPLENQKETPPRFAKRTRQIIARALNVAQTSHSYGDVMLLMKADELNQEKPSSYLVEMAQVESLFHLSSMDAVEFLVRYRSMNPDPSGNVTFGGFLRGLRLKATNLSEEIFRFVDTENNGMITFKQFLFASGHILKHPVFRRASELAFLDCDIGGHGYITEEQFGGAVRPAMPEMNKEEIHELFQLFDTDGDGRVSKEEFLNRLRRDPLLIALFSQFLRQNGLSEDGQTTPEEVV